jgi:hypothetical protein
MVRHCPQERFAVDIAGFPPLDETEERLPKDASALDRMARADSVSNVIAITMMEERQRDPVRPQPLRMQQPAMDLEMAEFVIGIDRLPIRVETKRVPPIQSSIATTY